MAEGGTVEQQPLWHERTKGSQLRGEGREKWQDRRGWDTERLKVTGPRTGGKERGLGNR
jgi:hypothetical protein